MEAGMLLLLWRAEIDDLKIGFRMDDYCGMCDKLHVTHVLYMRSK